MATTGGFKPWKTCNSARLYQIAASYNQSLFRGDPVCRANTGYIIQWATTVDIVGVALAFFDVDMNPISHWVASTATLGYCLVADDPKQQFVGGEDLDTVQLAQADVFANVNVVLGTGNSTTGLSAALIDSDSYVADPTDATLAFRLIGLAPIVGNAVYNATTSPNPLWIVTPNLHQLKTTTGL
jgi:hypothetical protein